MGETYFFRDAGQFDFIQHTVIPDLQRRRGLVDGPAPPLRFWSAGCATGEEPYSLAIVLSLLGLRACEILATDISRAALAKARRGVFGAWSLRGNQACLAGFLRPEGKHYVLSEQIRGMVTFQYLNLAAAHYPAMANIQSLDLILCRNVFIYFGPAALRQAAQQLYAALSAGGWLLTSASDPPLGAYAPFTTLTTPVGIVYRRPAASEEGLWIASEKMQGAPDAEYTVLPDMPEGSVPPSLPLSVSPSSSLPASAVPDAAAALAQGDYPRALALTRELCAQPDACAIHVRALAAVSSLIAAEAVLLTGLRQNPASIELHHLRAVLLLAMGRVQEAAAAERRVLYLDRTLAFAHFMLGSMRQQAGDTAGAQRAYQNAVRLAGARPPDEPVSLSDGQSAGALAQAAAARLAELQSSAGRSHA